MFVQQDIATCLTCPCIRSGPIICVFSKQILHLRQVLFCLRHTYYAAIFQPHTPRVLYLEDIKEELDEELGNR